MSLATATLSASRFKQRSVFSENRFDENEFNLTPPTETCSMQVAEGVISEPLLPPRDQGCKVGFAPSNCKRKIDGRTACGSTFADRRNPKRTCRATRSEQWNAQELGVWPDYSESPVLASDCGDAQGQATDDMLKNRPAKGSVTLVAALVVVPATVSAPLRLIWLN